MRLEIVSACSGNEPSDIVAVDLRTQAGASDQRKRQTAFGMLQGKDGRNSAAHRMANQVSFAHSDRVKETSKDLCESRERPVPHLFRRTPMPGQIQSIHRMVGGQVLVVEHPGV